MGHIRPLSGASCKYCGYTYDNIIGTCDECEMLIGCNPLERSDAGNFILHRTVNDSELVRYRQILAQHRYSDMFTVTLGGRSKCVLDMKFPLREPITMEMEVDE